MWVYWRKQGNKYSALVSTDKNKEILKSRQNYGIKLRI